MPILIYSQHFVLANHLVYLTVDTRPHRRSKLVLTIVYNDSALFFFFFVIFLSVFHVSLLGFVAGIFIINVVG